MAEVALLDSINPAAHEVFAESGLEVVTFPKSLSAEELAEVVQDVQLLGVRSGPEIPASVIEAGKNLVAIGCFCVGTNHVDQKAANDKRVAVFNSVHENTRSVADYVIASSFGLMRRISEHNSNMHDGTWTKTDEQSYEVRGKTIGIIGYGGVGGQVGVLAEAIGMNVAYFDPAPQIPSYGQAKRMETMEELLATSDVVTLHVPGGKSTKGMINRQTIDLMKPGACLINTSRGEVVDYEAIAEAIESGQLGGVAADVFEDEPSKKGDRFEHILQGVGKAVLTPHIAGSTIEAQTAIGNKTALKLLANLQLGNSAGSVNFPPLPLPALVPGTSRLLNVHPNVGGMLESLTTVINEDEVPKRNIERSWQATEGNIGYAAVDVEGIISKAKLDAINERVENSRTRVLVSP